MDLGIRDRVALVCGGSSGLGLAIARGLLAEGVRVALNGRNPARLEQALTSLNAGDRAVASPPTCPAPRRPPSW